jgi:hypothetical protein
MIQIIDPRKGDAEDDASSPKRRSLLALAGSLVAEISLPKLIVSWVLLIGLPSFVLGVGPLVVSAWVGKVSTHASAFFTGIWYVVSVLVLAVLGWLGGKPAFRLFENRFWSLQALGIQPAYAICREGPPRRAPCQRHRYSQTEYDPSRRRRDVGLADRRRRDSPLSAKPAMLPRQAQTSLADLASPHLLVPIAFANAVVPPHRLDRRMRGSGHRLSAISGDGRNR